jgi:hypothetical protein
MKLVLAYSIKTLKNIGIEKSVVPPAEIEKTYNH